MNREKGSVPRVSAIEHNENVIRNRLAYQFYCFSFVGQKMRVSLFSVTVFVKSVEPFHTDSSIPCSPMFFKKLVPFMPFSLFANDATIYCVHY